MRSNRRVVRPLASPDWEAVFADDEDEVTLSRSVDPPAELRLNVVAGLIWSLCDGARTIMEIQEIFSARYPQNASEIATSVVATLRELLQWGAVTVPDHEFPPVSCMCLTYARPRLLEEAIESFLRQDYLGEKELVVLNDFGEQELCLDHPEVRVINMPARFRTLGEKRNACAALCKNEILFVWDDDDIYLPHRISLSISFLNENRDFFKPTTAFFWQDGDIKAVKKNVFHSQSCWRRSIFDHVNGYPHIWSGQDKVLESKYRELGVFDRIDIEPDENFYIYRWSGTGSYHLSEFGRLGVQQSHERMDKWLDTALKQHAMPKGRVLLEPKWRQDYTRQTISFLHRYHNYVSASKTL